VIRSSIFIVITTKMLVIIIIFIVLYLKNRCTVVSKNDYNFGDNYIFFLEYKTINTIIINIINIAVISIKMEFPSNNY